MSEEYGGLPTELAWKIFIDRYTVKDQERRFRAGDLAVVQTNDDPKWPKKELGRVLSVAEGDDRLEVELLTGADRGSRLTRKHRECDRPLETSLRDVAERIATGLAAVEPDAKRKKKWAKAFTDEIAALRIVPGGRVWAGAGTGIPLTLFNCVAAETPVHTKDGICPISELEGPVDILTIGGVYRTAVFGSYGIQRLHRVTLENGDEIHATAAHEWLVSRQGGGLDVVTTLQLNGRHIPMQPPAKPELDRRGVAHGIVFGDGSVDSWGKRSVIERIDRSEELVSWVEPYARSVKLRERSMFVYDMPADFKQLPPEDAGPAYWRGFIVGLLAADGSVDHRGAVVLTQVRRDVLEAVRRHAAEAGFLASQPRQIRAVSNFGPGYEPCLALGFYRSSVAPEDLLLANHRERFLRAPEPRTATVRVVSVEPTERVEEVFCCNEPETHTMVIGQGYLTRQCYVLPNPRDSRQGIVDTLGQMIEIMSRGGGVGINVSSLRPYRAVVHGVNGRSSGAVSWMELYSLATGLVEQGGSRRGALMLQLDIRHPDWRRFVDCKKRAGKVENANISLRITDDFMAAVKENRDWTFWFPDTSHPQYNEIWTGDFDDWEARGLPKVEYETLPAREVWDEIIKGAWGSAEPGVVFSSRHETDSNSWYFNPLVCTNPCVTGDTPVATSEGYVKARDLKPGMRIRTPAGLKAIDKVYNNGVQRVYRVTFSDGGHLDCTKDHKLRVVRDKMYQWVPVSDLHVGDRIAVSPNESFAARRGLPLEALEYIARRGLRVGDYYDRRLGFFVGAALGDGTLRKVRNRKSHSYQCRMSFGAHESAWFETFSALLADMNIHTRRIIQEKEIAKGDTVVVHRAITMECYKLATLLAKIGLPTNVRAPAKALPDELLSLDRDFLAGVLDGLFSTDGSVAMKRDNPMLRFHTSSRELAQQVRRILLQFGIHGRIYTSTSDADLEYDGRSLVGTGRAYDLVVMNEGLARFQAEIGLTHREKSRKLQEIAQGWHCIGGTWTATVVSIEDTGREEEVFDVHEPETLTWVTNGYVSFDCAEQPLPAWGVCTLGHINLARMYDAKTHDVDWKQLATSTRILVRLLDDVVDATHYFIDENRENQVNERRIGAGSLGLGELLIRLGLRYGSKEAAEFTDRLYRFIAVEAYSASAELAREKGPFPAFDAEKFLQSGFMRRMPDEVRDKVREMGMRNVTVLTQAPTGCVAPDTLIRVNGALAPIERLGSPSGEQWQEMSAVVETDGALARTSHFYVNGYQDVKTVVTRRGFELTATPGHRIRVIDDDGNYVWRTMEDVQPGDVVVLKRGTPRTAPPVPLRAVSTTSRAVARLPERMSAEFAELLGLYMGDGYIKARGGIHIAVSKDDPDVLERVRQLYARVFGQPHAMIEHRPGCWMVSMTGYHVACFFEANELAKPKGNRGEGAAGAFIPEAVLSSGSDVLAAFLRGLFEADGSAGGPGRRGVTLVSASKVLIRQTQQALLGLGIVSTQRELPLGTGHWRKRPRYELRVLNAREASLFAERIGFIGRRKNAALAEISHRKAWADSVPVKALCDSFYHASRGLPSGVRQQILHRLRNGALNAGFVRDLVESHPQLARSRLGRMLQMGFFFDRVESVTDDECETYDLTVPGDHTYIANGFVSHNTVGTMLDTSTGIEPFYSLKFTRQSRLGIDEQHVRVAQEWLEEHPGQELPDFFVGAMDLSPEEHIAMQAAIQRWTDSSISKTANAPAEYTLKETSDLYMLAYDMGCKGVTVYRDKSRDEQVLHDASGDGVPEEASANAPKEGAAAEPARLPAPLPNAGVGGNRVNGTWGHIRPIPRPKRLVGFTDARETPLGKLFLTLNTLNGHPVELFATIGRAGSDVDAFTDAVARLVSLALRSGVDPQEVADQLIGIGGSRSVGFGPNRVRSVPDAIGQFLSEMLAITVEEGQRLKPVGGRPIPGSAFATPEEKKPNTETRPRVDLGDGEASQARGTGNGHANGHTKGGTSGHIRHADICPVCGVQALVHEEGCVHCYACGHSEC